MMMQASPSHVAQPDYQYACGVGSSAEKRQPAETATPIEYLHEQPSWIDAPEPVQAFMSRYSAVIAPGWRSLAERTLQSLVMAAAKSPDRRRALSQMCVFGISASLSFVVCTHADQTIEGILRKARVKSLGICEECSRPARLRQMGEEETATLCPHCAAPALLHYDIWVLLQSLRFLRAVNAPVVTSQIPLLLRASFVEAALEHRYELDAGNPVCMAPSRFLEWADGWRKLSEHLSVPVRYSQKTADGRMADESSK